MCPRYRGLTTTASTGHQSTISQLHQHFIHKLRPDSLPNEVEFPGQCATGDLRKRMVNSQNVGATRCSKETQPLIPNCIISVRKAATLIFCPTITGGIAIWPSKRMYEQRHWNGRRRTVWCRRMGGLRGRRWGSGGCPFPNINVVVTSPAPGDIQLQDM